MLIRDTDATGAGLTHCTIMQALAADAFLGCCLFKELRLVVVSASILFYCEVSEKTNFIKR